MRRLGWLACFLLLLPTVSSCSGSTGGDCGERFSSDIGLLTTQAWAELESASRLPADAPDSIQVYPLDVSRVLRSGHSAGLTLDREIAMHGSFIGQIRDAFRAGDQVFLALDDTPRSDTLVRYVVFRHMDGSHDFAQQCWMSEVQASIELAYGSRAEARIDELIGTVGKAETRRLFSRLD